MEPISDTVDRIMKVWNNAENKAAFLESLGFDDHEEYLLWINEITSNYMVGGMVEYLIKIYQSGESSRYFDDNAQAAQSMVVADLAICFMLIGKERERLEQNER